MIWPTFFAPSSVSFLPAHARCVLLLGALVQSSGVQAQNLPVLYEWARTYDATYQGALYQYEANVAKAEQAKANILPTAGISAGVSRNRFDNTNPVLQQDFNSRTATLSASQPLYRPANWAGYEQRPYQIQQAQAQLDNAEQDLIVRLSQAYFDVLAAQDTLRFVQAQKTAVAEQLASAQRNFEVGTATITDTREAQAKSDLVKAQEIAADNDLRIKKMALDQMVGKETQIQPLDSPVVLPALAPVDIHFWVQQSEANNPNIRQAQAALEVAVLEVEKAKAGHKPTLDLAATYNRTNNPAGTLQSGISTRVINTSVGLQFNLPLFAGFATQNRVRETLALQDKAQSELEGLKRSVAQAARTAYYSVVSGQSQVKALEAAELSSQSALEANQLGYQVGVRVNSDVLNTQSQLFQTKRDLAQARYNVLMGGLKLRQASGTLSAEDLKAVSLP